jgi:hypothetical protein
MMMKLPHSQFRWLTEQELDDIHVQDFDAAGDYGMVLEVAR